MTTTISRVVKDANFCGGDARIRGTRIPVWVLAGYRRDGQSDAAIREAYPSLKAGDLEAAWEYAAAHPDEIAAAIAENEAGEAGFVE